MASDRNGDTKSAQLLVAAGQVCALAVAIAWMTPDGSGSTALKGDAASLPRHQRATPRPARSAFALRRPLHWPKHEAIQEYWAGYALTGGTYTAAQGTWTVPAVTFVDYPTDPYNRPIEESISPWIGIGGDPDPILIQLGTDSYVTAEGTLYYAWYELYPADPVPITATRFAVNPGDTITAALQCTANCTPNGQSTWIMSMASNRWPTPFTIQVTNTSTNLASAEWIAENNCVYCVYSTPDTTDSAYLPSYGTIPFSALTVNGENPHLSRAQNALLVTDPEGKRWSVPSEAVGGNAFTVTFGQAGPP